MHTYPIFWTNHIIYAPATLKSYSNKFVYMSCVCRSRRSVYSTAVTPYQSCCSQLFANSQPPQSCRECCLVSNPPAAQNHTRRRLSTTPDDAMSGLNEMLCLSLRTRCSDLPMVGDGASPTGATAISRAIFRAAARRDGAERVKMCAECGFVLI